MRTNDLPSIETFADAIRMHEAAPASGNLTNNTTVNRSRTGNIIDVTLHRTRIVTWTDTPDGTLVTLDTGGWRTATTKARMNALLPRKWRVSQRKHEWYVERTDVHDVRPFADGITMRI